MRYHPLLLIAVLVETAVFGQSIDKRTAEEQLRQAIPLNLKNGEAADLNKISPGHVPSNIYDAVPPHREIQINDDRPIIRDFREAPTPPQEMVRPEMGIRRFDALPSPDPRCYPKNRLYVAPAAQALKKPQTMKKVTSSKPSATETLVELVPATSLPAFRRQHKSKSDHITALIIAYLSDHGWSSELQNL
jgi:hypothetical protein